MKTQLNQRVTATRVAVAAAIAVALVAGSTAAATHVFNDVADDRFFAGPVEWAAANGITTGTGPTTFEPDRGVTRGESVTFLKRYHDTLGSTPGPVGPQGERGFSAWDVIPSGTTVTGNVHWDMHETSAGAIYQMSVDIPAVAPQPLTDDTVNFAPDAEAATIDDDATCTGSVAAPTAPPGKVCLYLSGVGGLSLLKGRPGVPLADRGFELLWTAAGTGDMFVTASWAYTAP
jgi:hypothetical protein